MNNLVLTQLSTVELQELFRNELRDFFSKTPLSQLLEQTPSNTDEIGGIELAAQVTGLAKPTIYSLVSARKIPHSKKSKKLYFQKSELLEWLRSGRRKTRDEINAEAEQFQPKPKRKKSIISR